MIEKGVKSFIFQFLGSIIGFLLQFFAARILGAEEYGKYNYYYGFVGVFGYILLLGLPFYLPKIYHKYKDPEKLVSESISLILLAFLVLSPIIWIILTNYIADTLVKVFLVVFILGFALIEFVKSYYISVNKPVTAAIYRTFVFQSLSLLLFFVLLFLTKSFWALLGASITSLFIINLPFLLKKYKFSKPQLTLIKGAFPFFLVQILYFSYNYISRILQGEFDTYGSVAILSISLVIGRFLTMLGQNFALVIMPELARSWDQGDFVRINYLFKQITRTTIFIIFPILLFTVINSNNILSFLGTDYIGGDIILGLIILGSTATILAGPNGIILLMTGNAKKEIINGMILLTTGVLSGIYFGRDYYFGIALSISLANIVTVISKRIMTYRLLNLKSLSGKDILYIFSISIGQSVVFYFGAKIENFAYWVLLNGIFLAFFIILNFAISPHSEDKYYYQKVTALLLKYKTK